LTTEKLEKLNEEMGSDTVLKPIVQEPPKKVGYKNIPSLDAIAGRLAKVRASQLSIDGSAMPPEPEMIEDPKTPGVPMKAPEHPLQFPWYRLFAFHLSLFIAYCVELLGRYTMIPRRNFPLHLLPSYRGKHSVSPPQGSHHQADPPAPANLPSLQPTPLKAQNTKPVSPSSASSILWKGSTGTSTGSNHLRSWRKTVTITSSNRGSRRCGKTLRTRMGGNGC